MLETAMILLIFLTLIGAVCDLGVALYQWSILRHTTNLTARNIVVELASGHFSENDGNCQEFDKVAKKILKCEATPLMRTGGPNAGEVVWDARMTTNTGPFRSFILRGEMPANCFFLCRFFPQIWRLGANSTVAVDSASIPTCHNTDLMNCCAGDTSVCD